MHKSLIFVCTNNNSTEPTSRNNIMSYVNGNHMANYVSLILINTWQDA